MGLFDKFKRSLGYQDPSLRDRGTKGTATVLSSKKGMMSDDDGHHVYKTKLRVTVPGTDPYEITYKVEGGLTEGADYPVFVDPDDREQVFVDAESVVQERLEQAVPQLDQATAALQGDQAAWEQIVSSGNDQVAQLEQLAKLRQEGKITDEQFAAAKRKLQGW